MANNSHQQGPTNQMPLPNPVCCLFVAREMSKLIANSPNMVKEYHRSLGFISCSAELEMAGCPVLVDGHALGIANAGELRECFGCRAASAF